ncbi:MAG: zinc-dependent peptidase [Sphingobacteriales bacterium]|nr:zinc-dependent peptidase [Sphingobacteriales bacterium]
MPPGDTIILNSLDQLPDSIRHIVDSLLELHSHQLPGEEKVPQFLFPQWSIFLFVLLVAWASAYFYIIRPASAKRKKVKEIPDDDTADSVVAGIRYEQWLNKYNPYYASLQVDLKKRFLKRVMAFKESKEFRFHFMQPEEFIPVLISGAAVQLTFGLRHFLIEYFPVINIIKGEYSYSGGHKIVEGHVQVDNRSINISWNNFIQDYEDYTDSQNVGLHELAHAVSFDFLYGFHENKHPHYEEGLKEYIQVAAPVFKELRQGKPHFLDDYGALNVEEFWAVSIESFFENALEFRYKMPGLFNAICELLNQDPLTNEKIIDRSLAGFSST